jgi:hypothetical protein
VEWYPDIPPPHELVTLTNDTVYRERVGDYTYELRGRAGRWYIVRWRTETGEDVGAIRTKFFTSQARAQEIYGELVYEGGGQ